MNKSVLLLEENSVIHGLVGSALDIDGLILHHEFNPDNFVERAKSLMPDLIIISNVDQGTDYTVCRELKRGGTLGEIPLILLANSNDSIDLAKLAEVHVDGIVRKPFEASDLQQQVSKHLDVVDLIGSAYEYRQSQSIDDRQDPLADLQVLDSDVLGLLQAGDGPMVMGSNPPWGDVSSVEDAGSPLPAVDEKTLEETLQPESAFEPVAVNMNEPEDEPAYAGLSEEPASLADEFAVEPPEEELTFSQMHGIDDLDNEGMEFDQEDTIEELGAADLLEEESLDVVTPPSAFDQSLEGEEMSAAESMPLDQIEVEISDGQVDLDALDDDFQGDGVQLFDLEVDQEGEGKDAEPEGDIPMAVRRMMELKPIFTSQDEGAGDEGEEADEEYISLISSEGETGSFDEDLGTLDEIELDESKPVEAAAAFEADGPEWTPVEEEASDTLMSEEESTWTPPEEVEDKASRGLEGTSAAAEASVADELGDEDFSWTPPEEVEDEVATGSESTSTAAAEASVADELGDEDFSWTPPEDIEDDLTVAANSAAASMVEEDEDEEEFSEELLGNEELDEGRILAAMEEAQAEDEEDFGGELDDFEPEASEVDELVALSKEDIGAEDGELMLDQDEEAMMMAALEEEATFGEDIDDAPSTDTQLEQMETEAMGELEELEDSISEIEGMQPPAATELDDIAESGMSGLESNEPADAVGIGIDDDEFGLSMESEDDSSLMDELSEPDGLRFDDSDDDAADELAQQDISEYLNDELLESVEGEAELPPIDDLAGVDPDQDEMSGSGQDLSDFEEELLGLKADIEANPEGERLSDLLANEGVKSAVEDLEFQLPDDEHNLTRAMGISELPDDDSVSMDGDSDSGSLDEPTFATPLRGEEAGGGLPSLDEHAGMIDDAMKARLGEVLDEMITASVRKAVKEEIPKLMEQLEKENQ